MNIQAGKKQELKRDIPFESNISMMSRWPSATTATQGFKCNHDGAEGWTPLAERARGRTDGCTDGWTGGSEPQSRDFREIFITGSGKLGMFAFLQLISWCVIAAPAIEGGTDKLFDTNAGTQRTRSCLANVSRQQKKLRIRRFSALFKRVQHEQTEKMRIYAKRDAQGLTSSLEAWAPPSRRADVVWNSLFELERSRVYHRDACLRCVALTLTGCCYRIIWNTESNFWQKKKKKKDQSEGCPLF